MESSFVRLWVVCDVMMVGLGFWCVVFIYFFYLFNYSQIHFQYLKNVDEMAG